MKVINSSFLFIDLVIYWCDGDNEHHLGKENLTNLTNQTLMGKDNSKNKEISKSEAATTYRRVL